MFSHRFLPQRSGNPEGGDARAAASSPPAAPKTRSSLRGTRADLRRAGGRGGAGSPSLPARGVPGETGQASFPAPGPVSQLEYGGEKMSGGDDGLRREAVGGGDGVRGLQVCAGRAALLARRRSPAWTSPPCAQPRSVGATSPRRRASGWLEPGSPGLQGAGLGNLGFPFRLHRISLPISNP